MPHRQGLHDLINSKWGKDTQIYGIEIGCFNGDLAKSLLDSFPSLSLTSIDPYPKMNNILENVKGISGEYGRFQLIPVASNVAYKLLDRNYHFVFIDGDHSYEQCKRDIQNYLPLVGPGGLISGHNYHKGPCKENNEAGGNSAHPGVHQAVDEIFGDRVKLAPDFIWYVEV